MRILGDNSREDLHLIFDAFLAQKTLHSTEDILVISAVSDMGSVIITVSVLVPEVEVVLRDGSFIFCPLVCRPCHRHRNR